MSDLVAVAEIAAMLGISKQRVYQILDEDDTFPAPADQLTVGRIWRRSEVERWAKRTGRIRVTPFLLVLAGGLITLGGAWLADRRAYRRERDLRTEERDAEAALRAAAHADAMSERRRAFEVENLLALQDALQAVGRATARAHVQIMQVASPEGLVPPGPIFDVETEEEDRQAFIAMSKYMVRIHDDALRTEVFNLRGTCSSVAVSKTTREAQERAGEAFWLLEVAIERTGERLRALH